MTLSNQWKFVQVIIRFRAQFGINLHEWVFKKAEIARAASAGTISALKNLQVQISSKLNEKNRMIFF